MMQVLNRLASTKHADLAKILRHTAASSLLTGPDTLALLRSSLVPKVLAILRSLPSGRPPRDAIAVCMAATAVLNNLYTSLLTSNDRSALSALLQADAEACCAVVHWGMAQAEYTVQPPVSDQLEWRHELLLFGPEGADDMRHPFWTSFTHCLAFLTKNMDGSNFRVDQDSWSQLWPQALLEALAAPNIIERVLRVAAEHPCGRRPPTPLLWDLLPALLESRAGSTFLHISPL
jgi:hypothetical protein